NAPDGRLRIPRIRGKVERRTGHGEVAASAAESGRGDTVQGEKTMKAAIEVAEAGSRGAEGLATAFAVADITPIGDHKSSEAAALFDIVLPVNRRADFKEVVLSPGSYRVRARLPSGATLFEDVAVRAQHREATLVLRLDIPFRRGVPIRRESVA